MNHGTRPLRPKHTDFDFIRSHKLGAISSTSEFPDEFFTDSGLTMPNQNIFDTGFYPPVPAMPYGCTNEAQADITTNLTSIVHSPEDLEKITHANALKGYDLRASLDAARKQLLWFKQYFNVRCNGFLDWFDTFRLAQLMGVDAGEKRALTLATPWFPSWEEAIMDGARVMKMPTDYELANVSYLNWHNSVLDGWTVINGIEVYRDKSWQGNEIGFIYFPRGVINRVMAVPGTAAFVPTNVVVDNPLQVTLPLLQWVVSQISYILSRYL